MKSNISKKNSRKRPFKNDGKPIQEKSRKTKRKENRQKKKAQRTLAYERKLKSMKEWRLSKKRAVKNKGNQKPRLTTSEEEDKNTHTLKNSDLDEFSNCKTEFSEEPNDECHNYDVEEKSDGGHEEKMMKGSNLAAESLAAHRTLKKMRRKMTENRKKALLEANEEEDKIIKTLEKKLGLRKRKTKSLPSSFVSCGLDYILDVCNPDKMKLAVEAEKNVHDSLSQFEEDLALVKGKVIKGDKQKTRKKSESSMDEFDIEMNDRSLSDDEDISSERDMSEEVDDDIPLNVSCVKSKQRSIADDASSDVSDSILNSESDLSDDNEIQVEVPIKKIKNPVLQSSNLDSELSKNEEYKTFSKTTIKDQNETFNKLDRSGSEDELHNLRTDNIKSGDNSEIWEDIYGRKRDKKGNVLEKQDGKYIPPQLRVQNNDSKKKEDLEKLKRNLKGLLNRLAETNMHSISTQIEDFYMRNSRNDMNETLIALFMDAIVSHVMSPERLILEHCMLTAILHANVGTEIGAYCLQKFVQKFDELEKETQEVGDKRLDNVLLFISHLYTFQIFDSCLLYDILNRLCNKFSEKEIELVLVILRSVGFTLRKNNPVALKDLVLKVQKLANETSIHKNSSRVRFMLDVLMTIKNNNMSKLPQYDPSLCEHLKKILKSMIRKGNYVTQLKISLEDLLNVEEQGRWWIVGSAWSGSTSKAIQQNVEPMFKPDQMSSHLLELAKKLRMNTDSRRNIFCILMTAEDFNDAFEKLVKLGLKGHMEREVISVLTRCLLSEKEFNPYYAYVANRCCQADRRHQMTMKCNLWDHFKEIEKYKPFQITNLAKFMSVLFIEGTLPISLLKVIEFVDMNKGTTRLLRQTLLSLLYNKDECAMVQVFLRVTKTKKLHLFRESLRLFLHHLLLKNINEDSQDYSFLKTRINLVDRTLQNQN